MIYLLESKRQAAFRDRRFAPKSNSKNCFADSLDSSEYLFLVRTSDTSLGLSNKGSKHMNKGKGTSINIAQRDLEQIDKLFPELPNRSKKIRLAVAIAKHFVDQNSDRINIVVL
ncbi:MAG: hypothetical protein J0L70_23765 [Leptolyngbya sp. UWPOB_LEPTO1]|uniref:hypothetical protein n=1 Tax=Leptolyngbya sp. UWPOB_LEPTO1 TaxID=2815653 RepID=UPI001AD4FB74|nr:hypothetical protein [Leptolyngbya sp. UWPOB_LEPTO1]MBN8563561.1 hypothetical protein [Leptolyngbya sp. UWPOB_LEPTO1]